LPPLLKAAEEEGLTILWVAVSASLFTETEVAAYQAVTNPSKLLDFLSPSALNAELVKVAQKIKEVAARLVIPLPVQEATAPTQPTPLGAAAPQQHKEQNSAGSVTFRARDDPHPCWEVPDGQ
jgi:hypothetical protein